MRCATRLRAGWDGGLDDYPSARALIADLLLGAGRAWEAERAWREPWLERPAILVSIGRRGARTRTWACTTRRSDGARESLELADPDEGELLWRLAQAGRGSEPAR
jgi:hypothetical protein